MRQHREALSWGQPQGQQLIGLPAQQRPPQQRQQSLIGPLAPRPRRPRQRGPAVQDTLDRLSQSYAPEVVGQIQGEGNWTDQIAQAEHRRRQLWGSRQGGGKEVGMAWETNEALLEALAEGLDYLGSLGFGEQRF